MPHGQSPKTLPSCNMSGLLSSMRCLLSSVSGLLSSVSGLLSSVSGLLSCVSGLLCSVSGLLCSVSGLLCSVSGLLCSVSGLLCSVKTCQARRCVITTSYPPPLKKRRLGGVDYYNKFHRFRHVLANRTFHPAHAAYPTPDRFCT